MLPRKLKNAFPLQLSSSAINDMDDVSTVKALAARDKQLGNQQFLRSQDARLDRVNPSRFGAAYPRVLYSDRAVAHASDQVDEEAVAIRFIEPDRVLCFAFEALDAEAIQGLRDILSC
jgi:hypothetical protein